MYQNDNDMIVSNNDPRLRLVLGWSCRNGDKKIYRFSSPMPIIAWIVTRSRDISITFPVGIGSQIVRSTAWVVVDNDGYWWGEGGDSDGSNLTVYMEEYLQGEVDRLDDLKRRFSEKLRSKT